jgi:hypothetical protein
MSVPVILGVDADPTALDDLERALRGRYESD